MPPNLLTLKCAHMPDRIYIFSNVFSNKRSHYNYMYSTHMAFIFIFNFFLTIFELIKKFVTCFCFYLRTYINIVCIEPRRASYKYKLSQLVLAYSSKAANRQLHIYSLSKHFPPIRPISPFSIRSKCANDTRRPGGEFRTQRTKCTLARANIYY